MPVRAALPRVLRKPRFVMGGFLFVAFIAACNLSDDDFGFGFGGSGGTSGTVPVPTQTPEPVTPCSYANEGYACNYSGSSSLCENGKSGNINCNALLKCDGYQWELDPTVKAKREAGACALTCPAAASPGVDCNVANANSLICEYQETTCGCGIPQPDAGKSDAGKKDGGSEAGVDAGVVGDGGSLVWTCVTPGPGCPRVRPRVGSPCVKPITCDYGACTFDDGLSVRCSGGYWLREAQSFCP